MAIDFSADLVDMFSTDDFAVSGVYTPIGGGRITVKVLLELPQEADGAFLTDAIIGAYTALIQASELSGATVAEGDVLTIGSATYTVISPHFLDERELIYTMQLTG